MAMNPRLAFDQLIGAFESFHQAAITADDPEASSVVEAADRLADAFAVYDDVMYTEFGVETPFDVYDEDDEDDDVEDYYYDTNEFDELRDEDDPEAHEHDEDDYDYDYIDDDEDDYDFEDFDDDEDDEEENN